MARRRPQQRTHALICRGPRGRFPSARLAVRRVAGGLPGCCGGSDIPGYLGLGAPLAPESGGVGSELRPQRHAICPSRCGSTVVAWMGSVEPQRSLYTLPRRTLYKRPALGLAYKVERHHLPSARGTQCPTLASNPNHCSVTSGVAGFCDSGPLTASYSDVARWRARLQLGAWDDPEEPLHRS